MSAATSIVPDCQKKPRVLAVLISRQLVEKGRDDLQKARLEFECGAGRPEAVRPAEPRVDRAHFHSSNVRRGDHGCRRGSAQFDDSVGVPHTREVNCQRPVRHSAVR